MSSQAAADEESAKLRAELTSARDAEATGCWLSIYLSIYLFIYLSIYLYIYIYIYIYISIDIYIYIYIWEIQKIRGIPTI